MPTRQVVDRMLELARLIPEELVYDLGSRRRHYRSGGKKVGVQGVGIEIDADLLGKAPADAFKEKVEHLVQFRVQDALTADVSQATVVTLYMLPEFNAKLRPILDRQ